MTFSSHPRWGTACPCLPPPHPPQPAAICGSWQTTQRCQTPKKKAKNKVANLARNETRAEVEDSLIVADYLVDYRSKCNLSIG